MTKKSSKGVAALGICCSTALALGSLSLAVIPSAFAASSAGPLGISVRASATGQSPGQVLIYGPDATRVYRFPVAVPEGGRLRPVDSTANGSGFTGDILVEDATGSRVGAYDGAWAQDAAGQPVPTGYRIEGATLVQTVEFGPSTAFPVVIEPTYSAIGATGSAVPSKAGAMRTLARAEGAATAAATVGTLAVGAVGVPSNYVYNPSLGTLNDYCSKAPDEYHAPYDVNADFRGPCARHDLCYGERRGKSACDNALYDDMVGNCDSAYAPGNSNRNACRNAAWIYWLAVTTLGRP
jgi:hypothetical protein